MKKNFKELWETTLLCLIATGVILNLNSKIGLGEQDKQTPAKQNVAKPDSVQRDSLMTDFNIAKQWTHPNLNQKTR